MHSPDSQPPNTGPGGDDLSISELSLSDRSLNRPFTLLARPPAEPSTPSGAVDDHDQEDVDPEKAKRLEARLREEKLQSDTFILRKLNASFALFNEALAKTETANECLAMRLEQTDALLTKYVNILSKSEQASRLLLDEKWLGAEDDENVLHLEAEKAQREAEERLRTAQQAQLQREREAKERAELEENERLEKKRKENTATRGSVRGVRGTRASMRGTRGLTTTTRISTGTVQAGPSAAPAVGKSASGRPSGLPTRAIRGT